MRRQDLRTAVLLVMLSIPGALLIDQLGGNPWAAAAIALATLLVVSLTDPVGFGWRPPNER